MKNHKYILLALSAFLLAAVSAGCSDDIEPDPVPQTAADCFNITVSVPVSTASRAASDDLNEYKVNSLHLFFFPTSGHDDNSSEYLFHYVVDQPFEYTKKLRINLPDDAHIPGMLFGPTGTDCLVYAVANVDESLLTGRTVSALKATVLSSDFDKTEAQPAFAMDGSAVLFLDWDNRSVTGDIKLQRAAAKLTLAISLPESIEVTETEINPLDDSSQEEVRTYRPLPEQMHVWMGNGVKKSVLNTAPTPAPAGCLYSNEISIADGVGSSFSHSEELPEYPYLQEVPFYSYPNSWLSTDPANISHLTLVVPWQYEDGKGQTQTISTYYRLEVQPGANRIERNTHYDMRVKISRLGSTSIQSPLELSFDWSYAIPWITQNFQTDIKNIRYLLLNNNDFDTVSDRYVFTMNNETDINITYSTSHQAKISKVTLKWRDYYNDTDREYDLTTTGDYKYSGIDDYDPATVLAGIELDYAASTLKLKREMRHLKWDEKQKKIEITNEPAFNAYTFEITLCHTDNSTQEAKVRITQYPAIYITSQSTVEEGYRIINANNTDSENGKGFVNSNDNEHGSNDLYLGPLDRDKNHNTYIINITRFENENYIIGDPRSLTVDNLGDEWTMEAPVLSNNHPGNVSRMLTYYYPTDATGSKKDLIAPKLRIASQWGVSSRLTRLSAKRRCASYQENGRPAGRWRLPTFSEIEYIANLSSKRYIPYLFGNENSENEITYWCGSGTATVYNKSIPPKVEFNSVTNPTRNFVRCVYDEWYWGNDTLADADKKTFVWGDKPRSFSGNP